MTVFTPSMIEWRESELADAVAYLDAINPKGYTADDIKAHATREWINGNGKATFVGTAGWYVSIVPKGYESDTPYIALVSIMPYTALHAIRGA